MIVQKFFNKKVEKEYFFIQGKVNIDADYFINKIKSCWGTERQRDHFTNVKGLMTDWQFFNHDEKFLDVMSDLIEYIDENVVLPRYKLSESWGIELQKKQYTAWHTHTENVWAGVLYLNDSNQELIFPEINQKVKPEVGTFALFSGILKHGCKKNKEDFSKFAIAFNMEQVKNFK